jgi:hypothetical protein
MPREDSGHDHHDQERGKDTADATLIEGEDGEAPRGEIRHDNRADEKAGDDKKDVYADKAAIYGRTYVEEQNQKDGDRT